MRTYRRVDRSCQRDICHPVDERCALEQQDVAIGVGPVYSSYTHLVEMLAQGWQIEPPIYVRPRWRSSLRLKREKTYHFVLWQGDQVNLVSVLDSADIQRFLTENQLAVDRL